MRVRKLLIWSFEQRTNTDGETNMWPEKGRTFVFQVNWTTGLGRCHPSIADSVCSSCWRCRPVCPRIYVCKAQNSIPSQKVSSFAQFNLSGGIVLARDDEWTPPNASDFWWEMYAVLCERPRKGNAGGRPWTRGFLLRSWMITCSHIIPSSPMPGNPALTPNPKPTAAIWLFSFRSGLQGGECWRCLEMSAEVQQWPDHQLTYFNPFRFLYLLPQISHL